MAEDPEPDAAARRRALDAQIETLAQEMAQLVNSADVEDRQDLREYAIGLLKEETELSDAPSATRPARHGNQTNPLGLALLLAIVALPLLLLFPPFGVTMLGVAGVMGLWGLVATLLRRP